MNNIYEERVKAIVMQREEPSSWDTLIPKLRKAGKDLLPKVVRDAVKWARSGDNKYEQNMHLWQLI